MRSDTKEETTRKKGKREEVRSKEMERRREDKRI
jgi:hypothetical protein